MTWRYVMFKTKRLLFLMIVMIATVTLMIVAGCSNSKASKSNVTFKAGTDQKVAAKIGDQTISFDDLHKGIESELFEAEMKVFELKYGKLQGKILEILINKNPKKGQLTNDEFMDQYIAKGVTVTEKEIEAFIKERQIPEDQLNPEIRERIKQFITMEKKRKATDVWMEKELEKTPVEVYFQKPTRPKFAVTPGNSPFKGGEDAKVTIVEFSDFQCPFCSKGATLLTDLEKKYGKKIKVHFKQFPLPFHNQAKFAANAALCANEQGVKYFWKIHDGMFKEQSKLDRDSLIQLAKKNGLKEKDFVACVDGGKFNGQVESDIKEGEALGVKSTPTFYVNGILLQGALPLETFSEIIDQELNQ